MKDMMKRNYSVKVEITDEQELAILTAMDWDGQSMPYPLVREWLNTHVQLAVDVTFETIAVNPALREAYLHGDWRHTQLPEAVK